MIQRAFIAGVLLATLASPVAAQSFLNEPIIDEDNLAIREVWEQRAKEECDSLATVAQKLICRRELSKQFTQEGHRRGTAAYCKRHYVGQDTAWLRQKYKELDAGRYKAKAIRSTDVPGEVTQEMFKYEAWCVQEILRERGVKTWVPE